VNGDETEGSATELEKEVRMTEEPEVQSFMEGLKEGGKDNQRFKKELTAGRDICIEVFGK